MDGVALAASGAVVDWRGAPAGLAMNLRSVIHCRTLLLIFLQEPSHDGARSKTGLRAKRARFAKALRQRGAPTRRDCAIPAALRAAIHAFKAARALCATARDLR